MARIFLILGAAFSALVLLTPRVVNAQIDNLMLPSGSMIWHYQCKAGMQCPTKCSLKGSELFSTSEYISLTILQLTNQNYWFRIDTGRMNVDYYVTQADPVTCSIVGATLISARTEESGKAVPSPRP